MVTKLVYSIWYFDRNNERSQINNRVNLTVGVNSWSFSLKPEMISLNNGNDDGFQTKAGDLRFSILNTFYVKGKHALAYATEFTLPTADQSFGGQYFAVTPSLTYAYTFNTSLFLAIAPQYTFDLQKKIDNAHLSVLTVRTFLAKFFKSGWFFVFEPRIINNFQNDDFDLIFSPIVGKALGSGFNLTSVLEIPQNQVTRDNRGILLQLGITKNFNL